MESTGVYWKPLYNLFELMGLEAIVVNASHMKALPGRKTDIKDAEWIADLLRHGLLKTALHGSDFQRYFILMQRSSFNVIYFDRILMRQNK